MFHHNYQNECYVKCTENDHAGWKSKSMLLKLAAVNLQNMSLTPLMPPYNQGTSTGKTSVILIMEPEVGINRI